ADWERERRLEVEAILAEVRGEIPIVLGARILRLTTRADRIERLSSGKYAILDYKTGTAPSEPQVRLGISPQLSLEAAILRNGGFAGIDAGASVAELVYLEIKGGDPAGEAKQRLKDDGPDCMADHTLARLREFALRFEDAQQAYEPLVMPKWKSRY